MQCFDAFFQMRKWRIWQTTNINDIGTIALIFSWPMRTTVWLFATTYGFYVIPALIGIEPGMLEFRGETSIAIVISNQLFLLATMVITASSQRHRFQLEESEFIANEEQKRLLEKVQTLATIDSLTGLNNRRHLFACAEREVLRAYRYNRPLCLMMIDIDRFKDINDNYGHWVGDQVIQATARRITATARDQDIVGRYGGEEFVIVLPETKISDARDKFAERPTISWLGDENTRPGQLAFGLPSEAQRGFSQTRGYPGRGGLCGFLAS